MEVKPLRRDSVPAGYKQTEVGVIPDEWEVSTAAAVCDLVVDCKNRTPPVVDGGDYAVVRTPNVRKGKFIRDDLRFTDEQSFREWTARAIPQVGDILITREAPLGEVCLVPSDVRVCLGQRMMLYRTDQGKAESHYLLYALMSSGVQSNLLRKIGGSTVGHAKVDDIRNLQVPLPPTKAEQEAIAEALSDADALIESLEQLLAKKRHLKQGAMQELLTGKKRLPGYESKPGYKHTEVGVIPEDWTVKSLGLFCEISAGRDLVKLDFSSIPDYRHEFPIYSNALTNGGLYGYSKSYQYGPDKITVTARGDVGHAVYRDTPFCAIGRLLVLSSTYPCDLRFVTEFINQFVDFALESTGVPQLTAPQISKYMVALPATKAEQTAIAAILSDMDAEIAALEAKLAKARQLKQGMMQELLTGRIRLV